MAVAPGTLLGPYRLHSHIGSGGMGEVWKATDSRLGRTVAIKLLKGQHSERFEQEARTIASLNHPNICSLFDVGPDYLVMEFIDGKSVKGPLPLGAALDFAIQIAEALAHAHAAGIIHRDLKPANILVNSAGRVKLLDFGLAKAIEQREAGEGTTSLTQTTDGAIVGTVSYMSPEQAEGKKLDPRSDVFSFGAVLYEMLSGKRAFRGESSVSTLAAILKEEPTSLSTLAPSLPPALAKVVGRCLRKDRDRRYQNMTEVRLALLDLKEESSSGQQAAAPVRKSRFVLWATIAAAVVIGAGIVITRQSRPASPVAPQLKRLTKRDGSVKEFGSISPDGKMFAFTSNATGEMTLYAQQLGGDTAIELSRTSGWISSPSFSPSGTQIAYTSSGGGQFDGSCRVISTLGGQERIVHPRSLQCAFSPDGQSIAGLALDSNSIWVTPAKGGATRLVPLAFPPAFAGPFAWLPDGRRVLISTLKPLGAGQVPAWYSIPLDGGAVSELAGLAEALGHFTDFDFPYASQFWDDGVLFTMTRDGLTKIWLLPVDAEAWRITGPPRPVTTGASNEFDPSIDRNGEMLFTQWDGQNDLFYLPIDWYAGRVTGPPRRLTRDERLKRILSAKGTRVMHSSDGRWFVLNTETNQETELGTPRTSITGLVLSLDGRRLPWMTNRNGKDVVEVLTFAASGDSFTRETLCEDCGTPVRFFADGRHLLMTAARPGEINKPSPIEVIDVETKRRWTWLEAQPEAIRSGGSMAGEFALLTSLNPSGRTVAKQWLVPWNPQQAPPRSQWIAVPEHATSFSSQTHSWSGTRHRYRGDGGRSRLQILRFDRKKRQYASRFEEIPLPGSFRFPPGMDATHDGLVFTQPEYRGDIWMMQLPGKPYRQ